MKERYPWVKLPSGWIQEGGLRTFGKLESIRADETSALMSLIAIAHHSSPVTGVSRITYDELKAATLASRAKISNGLEILTKRGLLIREPEGRSSFNFANFKESRWCQIPAKRLYNASGQIMGFEDFKLRQSTSLNALKAYLLIATRRDTKSNRAYLTHKQINEYSGIPDDRIKSALSLLTVTNLILVDQLQSPKDPKRPAFAYRLRHLDSRRHQATISDEYTPLASSSEFDDFDFGDLS